MIGERERGNRPPPRLRPAAIICLALAAALTPPPAPGGTVPLQTSGVLAGYELGEERATHWRLPRRLTEISGLAVTRDGRLLAHHDEAGVVFELDYRTGAIVKEFALADGEAPVRGDFEGIATVEERIYLVTSAGRLYEFHEGTDREPVLFTMYATGVGQRCEIEGLAYDASRRALLLLCKRPVGQAPAGRLRVHAWSVDRRQLDENGGVVLEVGDFSRHLGTNGFRPSGIEWHPDSGRLLIVAARQQAIAEVTPDGAIAAVRRFSAGWHRQVEGVTLAPDGSLIVADEGAGGRGRLTVYPAVSLQGAER